MEYFERNYTECREDMVNHLMQKGITDSRILHAMAEVPRHKFLGRHISAEEAYMDIPLPIGSGQTISQPFTVAYQTQLLNIKEGQKVLEIGTGSGYQAAVLSEMHVKVYTVERIKRLYDRTNDLLDQLGYSDIKTFYGDGNEGLPEFAPFDKILITAAASEIPEHLIQQLKIDGVMIVPLNGNVQKMMRITKKSEFEINIEQFDYFRFVPLLEGTD